MRGGVENWYSQHREEGKKIHLSQDLKETKSSKYRQVIAGKKLLVLKVFDPRQPFTSVLPGLGAAAF